MAGDVIAITSPDYLILIASLVFVYVVGIVADKIVKPGHGVNAYMLGDRRSHFIPLGLSMIAAIINGAFVIGGPAEIYYNGAIYSLLGVPQVLLVFVSATLFIPIFYQLDGITANQYLEIRFNKIIRVMGALAYTLYMVFFLGVLLFAPAFSFSTVTGLPIWFTIAMTGVFVTKFTVVGGITTCIWAEASQMIIILAGLTFICALGGSKTGSASDIWDIAKERGRVNFNDISLDPRARHTIWTQIIGNFFSFLPFYGANQMIIQRYKTAKCINEARKAVVVAVIVVEACLTLVVCAGLIMHAYFKDCDPFNAGQIKRQEVILTYFLRKIANNKPGLLGVFIAAVYASALSSMSAAINAMAAIILEDFIQPILSLRHKELQGEAAVNMNQLIAALFGILAIGLSYIANDLGPTIVQIPITIWSIVGGPLMGTFLLGMCFPFINSLGAGAGIVTGLAFNLWLGIGSIASDVPVPSLYLSIANCTGIVTHNVTSVIVPITNGDALDNFYKISYTWYSLLGLSICIITGIFVSILSDCIRFRKIKRWVPVDSKWPGYISHSTHFIPCSQRRPRAKSLAPSIKGEEAELANQGEDNDTFSKTEYERNIEKRASVIEAANSG